MKKKRMFWKIVSLALCLTLTASALGAVVPDARAANGNATAYTFGRARAFKILVKKGKMR